MPFGADIRAACKWMEVFLEQLRMRRARIISLYITPDKCTRPHTGPTEMTR